MSKKDPRRDCCTITRPAESDRCDDCGKTLGGYDRKDKKFTVDDWDTVGCSWAHAEAAARSKWGGLTPLGVWRA